MATAVAIAVAVKSPAARASPALARTTHSKVGAIAMSSAKNAKTASAPARSERRSSLPKTVARTGVPTAYAREYAVTTSAA
jgi:hypothetical protein